MGNGGAKWFPTVLRGNGARFHRSMGARAAGDALVDRVVTDKRGAGRQRRVRLLPMFGEVAGRDAGGSGVWSVRDAQL